ncbi:hypothetical protein [Mycobacterium sp. URHD0025]|uniref:hypothetical protein n=1 Tax=Mycobacterium sp. URHD0025 TaxID=1298864 RepID=UPI0003FC124C|nr:hypothetical protein [Mycobacterium sp. URHD0025]
MSDVLDWANYPDLPSAVTMGIRDSDDALAQLSATIDFDRIRAFVLTRDTVEYEWGISLWQEVAVTDGVRLVLWHGSDGHCAGHDGRPSHPTFTASVRSVRLSDFGDHNLYCEYDVEPDESRLLRSVDLTLIGSTPRRSFRTTVTESEHQMSKIRFTKTFSDGDAQMHRLLHFAAAVTRQP